MPTKRTDKTMPVRSATIKSGAVKVSKTSIIRAVASSTAIETGKPIRLIEKQLRASNPKLRSLALAK